MTNLDQIREKQTTERLLNALDKNKDVGSHYRKYIKFKVTQEDLDREYISFQLDPFRLAKIFNFNYAQLTILKKLIRYGTGGFKSKEQDLNDIIGAAERELEIIKEDIEIVLED